MLRPSFGDLPPAKLGVRRLLKKSFVRQQRTSAAGSRLILRQLWHEWNSCPSQVRLILEFFSRLFGHAGQVCSGPLPASSS